MKNTQPAQQAQTRPLNVYLDQSAYGYFLNESPEDWKKCGLARLLLEAQAAGALQVWASPTNVLETLQATDLVRRRQLAQIILDLIEAQRMWHGRDLQTIQFFMDFLQRCAPEVIRYPEFLKARIGNSRRIWLGGLALIAAAERLPLEALIHSLSRVKATSLLLHARFAVNPHSWVDKMIRTVEEHNITKANQFEEFDVLTLEQMEAEISELEPQFCRLANRDLQRLNREREKLARTYGTMEVGRILQSVFTLPFELQFIFDIPHLVKSWGNVRAKTGYGPLPKKISEADENALLKSPEMAQEVLQHAIFAVGSVGLLPQTIAFGIILRDLQKSINDRRTPTGGLTFDADHITAMTFADIFISRDVTMTESAKTVAKSLANETKGKWQIHVVGDERQLAKALQTGVAKWEAADVSVDLDIWGAE